MTLTITQALSITLEKAQSMTLSELAELHNFLKESKQKKAVRKADLIAGVINGKKKELKTVPTPPEALETVPPEAKESGEPATIENSIKAPVKSKASNKKLVRPAKGVIKPKADQGEKKADKQEEKKTEPKKPVSLKPNRASVDPSQLSKEELLALVSQLEKKAEVFPATIEAPKTNYVRAEFETVEDIQKQLSKSPFSLFCFVNEKIDDDLTQFAVLFASSEVLVLLDRNRQRNTTIVLEWEQISPTHFNFKKEGKFEYAFYIRSKKA